MLHARSRFVGRRAPLALALSYLFHAPAFADAEAAPMASVTVEGVRPTRPYFASTGTLTQEQLEARVAYRPGELLEVAPGLIVSQHSGEGKANQFYLRGLNLDHGTDLSTTVDGMPVNQRTHAHGQGWMDLNFLVPELVDELAYSKGPYHAEQGDFSAAGAIKIRYADTLAQGLASIGIGQHGYARSLLADSPSLGAGKLLYGLELLRNEGPFVHGDGYRKLNGVLRYSVQDTHDSLHLSLMGYQAHWNASDQIPQRAIDNGLLRNRFDTLDPSDGGQAQRYSVSGAWTHTGEQALSTVNAYLIKNQLDLYSNFTYFLEHPDTGDQFSQPDRRTTLGLAASHAWRHSLFQLPAETTLGLQLQSDDIHNGLYRTQARVRLATTREDHVRERSAGLYVQSAVKWAPWLRSVAGLREDYFHNQVDSNLSLNSGTARAYQSSPSLSLIAGPWKKTEYFLHLGRGFHSNDARGTTIAVDPADPGKAATREAPIVAARGMELGLRSVLGQALHTSLALYQLDYNSELLFAGDAGSTADTGRPSRRRGGELNIDYKLADWLSVDADLAYARTRYRNTDPAGQFIPGSVEGVASLALSVDKLGPWFGAVAVRYFGPRPLIEDNSLRSKASVSINARIGYQFSPKLRLAVEVFNVSNRRDTAIDYAYQSRLPGEAAEGKFGVHFHPAESRSVRANLIVNF